MKIDFIGYIAMIILIGHIKTSLADIVQVVWGDKAKQWYGWFMNTFLFLIGCVFMLLLAKNLQIVFDWVPVFSTEGILIYT